MLQRAWADLGGPRGPWPPKRQKSPFALCIIVLQLQVWIRQWQRESKKNTHASFYDNFSKRGPILIIISLPR